MGTVGVVQGYGAGGTVVRCWGYGGCGGGVRWVRRGTVGTVEGYSGYGGYGYGGYGGYSGYGGHGGGTVGAVEGGYTRMVGKYRDEGRMVQSVALTGGRYLGTCKHLNW